MVYLTKKNKAEIIMDKESLNEDVVLVATIQRKEKDKRTWIVNHMPDNMIFANADEKPKLDDESATEQVWRKRERRRIWKYEETTGMKKISPAFKYLR